jgi:predicted O-methyltransferase YrrM
MFSVDWFSNNIPVWQKQLKRFVGQPVNALEIGSYEGMSALWLLHNILTHPKSRMYCIDSFEDDKKGIVINAFQNNMQPFKNKYKLFKGKSSDVLKMPQLLKTQFDVVYIDGNHHSRHVLEDAVLAFALLKPKGILIFDDYTNSKDHDNRCPKPAIDAFLNAYANEIKVIYSKWQVIVEKRTRPMNSKPCYSEFWPEPK